MHALESEEKHRPVSSGWWSRVLPKPSEVRFLAWLIGNTIVQKNSFAQTL